MQTSRMCRVVCAVAVLAWFMSAGGSAQTADERTFFTFSGPFELPGVALPAGTYLFRLADPDGGRGVVQVLSADGKKAYGMFFTRADDRITPSDKPEVRFMETPAGVPPAIKSWWYPLNLEGREFIYPKEQARRLAKNVTEPVLTTQAATTTTEQTNTADLARISSNGQETKVSGKAAAANPKGKSQDGTRAPASISVSNPSVPPEQHSR
jgi:hypothetical protein